ncbi:hypothetical protein ACFE04_008372 [Oxalis oulophora]
MAALSCWWLPPGRDRSQILAAISTRQHLTQPRVAVLVLVGSCLMHENVCQQHPLTDWKCGGKGCWRIQGPHLTCSDNPQIPLQVSILSFSGEGESYSSRESYLDPAKKRNFDSSRFNLFLGCPSPEALVEPKVLSPDRSLLSLPKDEFLLFALFRSIAMKLDLRIDRSHLCTGPWHDSKGIERNILTYLESATKDCLIAAQKPIPTLRRVTTRHYSRAEQPYKKDPLYLMPKQQDGIPFQKANPGSAAPLRTGEVVGPDSFRGSEEQASSFQTSTSSFAILRLRISKNPISLKGSGVVNSFDVRSANFTWKRDPLCRSRLKTERCSPRDFYSGEAHSVMECVKGS